VNRLNVRVPNSLRLAFATLVGLLLVMPTLRSDDTVWLDTLDLGPMKQGWGKPQVSLSMRGKPLTVAGRTFSRGVGTHAHSTLWIDLGGRAGRFEAWVGFDDAANGPGSVQFRVVADGERRFQSEVLRAGDPAVAVNVDLAGVRTLLLQVLDGGDGNSYDHANWGEARLTMADGARPRTMPRPISGEERIVLTPPPGPAPRIWGPRVYGCRPGRPFLYRIPTQGERPMQFSARGLPASLVLDAATGIITGPAPERGEHRVTLRARNVKGTATREFRIVSGDVLSLTPPMGYNHWYAHYDRITDAMMREAADVMVSSGMADVGYAYVNIDDCWMNAPKHSDPMRVGPLRDGAGNLVPNRHFPDMKGLADYIHAKGLKAGLYTSPGPLTCGGFAGAWQHEAQDAKLFAEWGYDFLKYDWCSYGDIAKTQSDPEPVKLRKPYQLMGDLLKAQPRDILYNLCQYGMGNVWEWGADVGGHCWRTAGDLGFELDRIFEVALKNAEYRAWSKPGAWNDPDYLQIGWIGAAHGMGEPKPCELSPSEQYAFMSLWCLSASPLFFSGDMRQLDPFTLGILASPEVIEIDQDPLGRAGRVVKLTDETFLMIKELEGGAVAVGLGNMGEVPSRITVPWTELGLRGRQPVRDVWRQKDLGRFSGEYTAEVGRRAVVMVRVGR
jgi:alpha-galactosidase